MGASRGVKIRRHRVPAGPEIPGVGQDAEMMAATDGRFLSPAGVVQAFHEGALRQPFMVGGKEEIQAAEPHALGVFGDRTPPVTVEGMGMDVHETDRSAKEFAGFRQARGLILLVEIHQGGQPLQLHPPPGHGMLRVPRHLVVPPGQHGLAAFLNGGQFAHGFPSVVLGGGRQGMRHTTGRAGEIERHDGQ